MWVGSIVKTSYVVAYLIAKNQNHLLMSLLGNVQKAWQIYFALKKKRDISKISLSNHTTARRIEEIRKSIERSLESKAAHFKFHAFVMDDSTDAMDTAQLAIFIRCINDEYNATEEMASDCH